MIESSLSLSHWKSALVNTAMPGNDLPHQTDDMHSSVHRAGDKWSASIWLALIKQIDSRNTTVASGSSKLRGSVNKAEGRKKFPNTGTLCQNWVKKNKNQ